MLSMLLYYIKRNKLSCRKNNYNHYDRLVITEVKLIRLIKLNLEIQVKERKYERERERRGDPEDTEHIAGHPEGLPVRSS